MKKINILCLHNKKLYDENIDRTFFHGYDAIGRHEDVRDFVYSGIGWDNYDVSKTVCENIERIYKGKEKPNVLMGVQYYLYKGMRDVNVLKVSRADETYKEIPTAQALRENKMDVVIGHHLNGVLSLQKRPEVQGIIFENIPRLVNTEIFKDFKSKKTYDLLLVGYMNEKYYPFRCRLRDLINNKWGKEFKCKILTHPGYQCEGQEDKDHVMREFSKEINRAKIVLTCSSIFRYALSKYFEVPRSMSLLAADLPNERHEFFREYMLVLDTEDTDSNLEKKIRFYLEHDKEREVLTRKGCELISRKRNQGVYADKFVRTIQGILENRK